MKSPAWRRVAGPVKIHFSYPEEGRVPIKSGDRLKTHREFKEMIAQDLMKNYGPAYQSVIPGSSLDGLLDAVANQMFSYQMDVHHYVMSHQVSKAGTSYHEFNIPSKAGTDLGSRCCRPEDLKWYDSGMSRFQYCTKCNKEHR